MTYIPTSAYEPGFPACWEGLDYASADDATPRMYGVSSGNGNDGVSHMFADYYVRTADPFTLAKAAMLSTFNAYGVAWADENTEIDGEAEYTISATILNPPDDDDAELDHSECEDGDDCDGCDMCESDGSTWCDANGAWRIIEVFRVGKDTRIVNGELIEELDMRAGRPVYDSLSDAFSSDLLAIAQAN